MGMRVPVNPPRMLRIQRAGETMSAVFELSGDIEERHVSELQNLLDGAIIAPGTTLDLKDVRLVDREAVKFLGDCKARGVKLENCRRYILEWIQARSFANP
jgi:hypothetical protein